MKRNTITLTVGLILIAMFAVLLFTYQVRQTEVALVTTFGRPSRSETNGLHFKLPWPVENVQIFDKRVQNFEDKLEETYTKDRFTLDVMLYAGWEIRDPALFREAFGGSISRARNGLDGVVRTVKMAVVGQHPFSHFISTDENELKFTQIEDEIRDGIRNSLSNHYGIYLDFVGIKMLRLPEKITSSVFDRMKEERQRVVQQLEGEGESGSITIRSEADRDRDKIIAAADTEANRIRSAAESEAAKYYAVLERNPDLAIFLTELKTLESSLKERSTLILDSKTIPFNLLTSTGLPPARAQGNPR
jgi:membrane protease subunit HflC